jgi:hypothetical protein
MSGIPSCHPSAILAAKPTKIKFQVAILDTLDMNGIPWAEFLSDREQPFEGALTLSINLHVCDNEADVYVVVHWFPRAAQIDLKTWCPEIAVAVVGLSGLFDELGEILSIKFETLGYGR